jgi:Flp pilus assembly protein TadD
MSCLAFRSLIVVLFALIAAPVFAQRSTPPRPIPVQVHGQMRYAEGGAPAFNIIVRLESFSGGLVAEAKTDRTGRFRFSGLTPGQYTISVHTSGYRDIQQQVDMQTATCDYVQLQLVTDKSAPTNATGSTHVISANVPAEARKELEKSEALLATGKKDHIEEAARHLERVLVIYPNFLEAQLKLGATYMDMQEWNKAEQVLNKAVETNPAKPDLLFALGELYLQTKKSSEAEKVLRQGLQIEPRSWVGRFALGRLYWNNGDIVKAGKQVALTLQLNPQLAEAHLLAGNILLRARKPDDAKFEFEEYLRLSPNGKYVGQTREVVKKINQARNQKP